MGGRRRKSQQPRSPERKSDVRPAHPGHAGRPATAPPQRTGRHQRPAQSPRRAPYAPLLTWRPPAATLESLASAAWLLPVVVALALALRIAHFVALQGSPFADSLVLDARYYDAWAQEIAAGAWIGRAPFWVDPLYAYVLAGLYAVAGHALQLARVLNFLFGLATVVLVARLAQQVWRSRAAAVAAALMAATAIPTLYFEGQHEKTALTVLLITAAPVLLLSGSLRAVAAAGAITGLAVLARGNTLVFVPLAALALFLGWDRERGDAQAPAHRGTRALVFLACALPIIGLATLHNWIAAREVVPTTTNLGVNLYLGNHADNIYGHYEAPTFLRPETGAELPDFRAEAERRTGQPRTDRELSSYWAGEAWDAIRAQPDLALLRTLYKLQVAVHDHEVPDNEDVVMVAEWSPVLRAPFFWLGELMPLGVLGAVIGWRRRNVRIVLAMMVVYLATLLPFFVMARLRVQIVPLLAVLGGGAVVWLIEAIRSRQTRQLVAAAAVAAPVLLVVYYYPEWMAKRRTGGLAIAWNNLGATLVGAGQPDDAIRAFERAVAIDARAVPASLRSLGDLYRRRGDYLRAEAAMRRVLELKPQSRTGREALRSLYAAMLQDARWRDDPAIRARAQALGEPVAAAPSAPVPAPAAMPNPADAAIAQARALARQGRTADAIRAMQDAVRKGPYDENLHYMLGDTMVKHAPSAEIVAFFSEEVTRDKKPQTSHYYWARGLDKGGDADGAVAHFQEALEIDPAHEMSQREWGALLERQGKLEDALEHYAEATRIHPEFRSALEDAARVATQLGRHTEAESYRSRAARADPSSPRRFVYWARYLHDHGRDAAAWPEIQLALREMPADPEALQLRDQIRATLGDAVPTEPPSAPPPPAAPAAAGGAAAAAPLSADARSAVVNRLAIESPSATWIVYDGRDAKAQRLATQLAGAFEEARWSVRSLGPAGFPVKPGIFLMIAEEPSATTQAVAEALDGAGLPHTIGNGYREFSVERQRADPNWRGLTLAPDQEYVILVGR